MSDAGEWRDERVRTFFFFFFFFFLFRSGMHLLAETVRFRRYGRYAAGTVSIFSGTKQRGYVYRFLGGTVYTGCIGRYGTKLTSLILSQTNDKQNVNYKL